MSKTFLTVAIVLAAAAGVAAGQQPETPPLPQPRFETRADLILVDVSVVDGDSRSIEGLTAADFELKVNGQPRPIQDIQYIATPGGSTPPERNPREAQYSSNEGFSTGRLVLFAVDENHLRVGGARGVLKAAQGLLDTFAPGDLVGLARLPGGSGGVEFTTDRARLRRGLSAVVGRQPSSRINTLRVSEAWAYESQDLFTWSRVIDRECGNLGSLEDGFLRDACIMEQQAKARETIADVEQRSMQTVRVMEDLLQRLAVMKTPITIVLISEGLFVARDRGALTEFARRAAAARVTLHALQPSESMFDMEVPEVGGGGLREDSLMGEGLEIMAGHTRGSHFRTATGSGEGAFERIRRELSGYYLLSFEPTEADRTGNRRIDVEVRRRGARVRARSTFALPDPVAVTAADAPAEEHVKDLLVAPLPASGLPIRVATYSISNGQDGKVRVIVSAEIGGPANDEVEWPVGFLLISKDEKFVVHSVQPTKLAPASPRSESSRLFLNSVVVEPGEYTVRIAAMAPDGRSGSVHHLVDARLRPVAGDAIKMSDLILSAPPSTRGAAPRPTPSAVIDSDTLTAALELSGTDAKRLARTRVDFEVAESESGPALMSSEGQSAPRTGSPERVYTAYVPLGLIPAGEYVVRAIVRVPGEDERRISRPFRAVPPVLSATEAAITRAEPADPDAAPVPPPPSRIIAPLPQFVPADVLKPDVVNAFLDALQQQHPTSAENAPIVAQARAGTFVVKAPDGTAADDPDPSLSFIRGLAALQKNEIAQAGGWFEVTLKTVSDFLGAAYYLGAVHAASGRDADAVGAWQLALIGGGGDHAYPVLVDAQLRLGDAQAALDLIEEAPDAWPSEEARLRRVAIAQAMLGRFKPALETATALLDKQGDDRDLLFVALQVLYRQHTDTPLTGADKERFVDYAARYTRHKGSQAALVSSWLRQVNK
jgi:VWFA-related protein